MLYALHAVIVSKSNFRSKIEEMEYRLKLVTNIKILVENQFVDMKLNENSN